MSYLGANFRPLDEKPLRTGRFSHLHFFSISGKAVMGRTGRDVTDAEMAVMQRLWEHGPATIRQLTEQLYGDVETQYATVKKLLERLEAKHCVTRDRSEMVHVFNAAVEREELIDRRLQEVADTLCEGSIAPLLTHAAKREELTKSQRELLHGLIDELENRSRKERKRKRK